MVRAAPSAPKRYSRQSRCSQLTTTAGWRARNVALGGDCESVRIGVPIETGWPPRLCFRFEGRLEQGHSPSGESIMQVEAKLAALGLELPEPMRLPAGVTPLWRQVKVIGT